MPDAKRRQRDSRRAVSPMVAVFILVVITLTIGVLVTSLSRNYITKSKTEVLLGKTDLKCGVDAGISIPVVEGQYKLCRSNSTTTTTVNLTVQNIGAMTIDDLQIKIYTNKGPIDNSTMLATPLGQGEIRELSITYDSYLGEIAQVNIVPRISKPGQTEKLFCEESQLVFRDVAPC